MHELARWHRLVLALGILCLGAPSAFAICEAGGASKPTIGVSYTGPDQFGYSTVTLNYGFPNTSPDPGHYLQRYIEVSLDGVPMNGTYVHGTSGQWSLDWNFSCTPTGTHTLTGVAVACGQSSAEFVTATPTPLTVNSTPEVSIDGFGFDANGAPTVDVSYKFPNTYTHFQRAIDLWTDVNGGGPAHVNQQGTTKFYISPCATVATAVANACGYNITTSKPRPEGKPKIQSISVLKIGMDESTTPPKPIFQGTVSYDLSTNGVVQVDLENWVNADGTVVSGYPLETFHVPPNPRSATKVFTFTAPTGAQHATIAATATTACGTHKKRSGVDCEPCLGASGNPVYFSDGNMRLDDGDLLPPIAGHSLARTYNSDEQVVALFGRGWSTLLDRRLITHAGAVSIVSEKNTVVRFDHVSGVWQQSWPTSRSTLGALTHNSTSGTYTYRAPGATEVAVFSASNGRLLALRDAATAREAVLDYDGLGRPETFTDTVTEVAWNLAYDGSTRRVTSISVEGRPDLTWTYSYDTNGNLVTVVAPGTSPWRTYEYTANRMTASYDAVGSVIESHTYDAEGFAISSTGDIDEIASIEYAITGSTATERITRATYRTGAQALYTFRPVGNGWRPVQITGGCSSCGADDATYAYDERGRTIREQNADGYITKMVYEGDTLLSVQAHLKPAGCDPSTDAQHCRLDSDALATVTLAPTSATVTTTYEHEDSLWPDRTTATLRPSVRASSEVRREDVTYHPITGARSGTHAAGWTGQTPAEEERSSHTTFYGDCEEPCPPYDPDAPAFVPGGSFDSAWAALPQPAYLPKSSDGPRPDVNDVQMFVYYPIHPSVPALLRGRLAAAKNAAGQIAHYETYDVFGNATRVVDPNGVATETTFDALGRLLTSTTKAVPGCTVAHDALCATDLTTTRSYFGSSGPPRMEQRASGGVIAYTYDTRGRAQTVSRGPAENDLRERVETTYDSLTGKKNLQKTLAFESGSWVEKTRQSFAYDADARLQTLTHADGAAIHYAYDVSDRITTVRDENHASPNTTYVYDPAGRLASVTQGLSGAPAGTISTHYDYDTDGNLISVTDPNGNVTSYVYDDFGQMIAQSSPVTGTTVYEYDEAGNLTQTTDANDASTVRAYDAANRVLTAASTKGTDTETVQWTYDSPAAGAFCLGRVATMTDPSGSTSYAYDRRGTLRQETRTTASASFTTSYGYDADRNRKRMVYPTGRVVETTFDFAGRPTAASTGATSIVTSAAYLPFGPATEIVYGNGTTRSIDYDERYRPLLNELTLSSVVLARYAYAHDAIGNILSLHDELDHGYDRNFAYDDLNRLTQANSGSALWGNGSYSYDPMGNLLSSQLGSNMTSFTYHGTLPKLLSVTENGQPRAVTYDAAGNELTAGATSSTYSPRNLLASSQSTYDYDGRGVRTMTSHPSHYLSALTVAPATYYPNQTTTGTVTLGGPAPEGGVTVELTSSKASIVVPATVSIGEGSSTAIFGITHTGTLLPGIATISAKHGLTRTASLTIAAAPTLTSLTLNPTSVVGGHSSEGTVVLDGPAPSPDAIIHIDVDGDGASAPPTISIAQGSTTGSFEIETTAVASTAEVAVTASYSNSLSTDLTVTAASLASVGLEPASIMAGRATVGRVTLNGPAPAGGATVTLTSSASQAIVPASVVVAAGQTTKTFSITTSFVTTTMTATIEGTYVVNASATLTITPCVLEAAPLPTHGAETVWIEDDLPSGATFYGPTAWTTSQKASGSQSLSRPIVAGESVIGVVNATSTLPVTWDEVLVFYVLTNECAPPQKLLAQWVATDGSWGGAAWGQTTNGHVYMGAMPTPGVWTRVEVPVEALNLPGRSIKGFYLYSYDGQTWIDRVGKSGDGCYVNTASAPVIPAGDRLWLEDDLPAGAETFPEQVWDASQKASGTRSSTRPVVSTPTSITFSNATATLMPVDGETLVFYALLHECVTPQSLRARWRTPDGFFADYSWGLNATGGPGDAPLPAAGVWTRYEVSAAQLGLEYRAISTIQFFFDAGQVWIDHIGAGAASCYPAIASPPTLGSETIWMEDALPAGATALGPPQWDPGQKASGSYSMTRPPTAGVAAYGFSNASAHLPVGWGQNLGFHVLLSECRTPAKIVAQWVASDGSWNGASWGQSEAGHVYMGALPMAGVWTWLEVPASQLLLEGTSLKGFSVYVHGGQAWIDRLGKTGTGCFPATAPAPSFGNETVWVDDSLPAGATVYGTTQWDTVQNASGTQSLTRPARAGENVIGFHNATATASAAVGDNFVFYALLNECATPSKLIAQWAATDGSWGGISWGQSISGHVYGGVIPASGVWTRLEVPAALLNLESKAIKNFYFYVYDGQAWVDRIGTAPPPSPATTIREAFANPERQRESEEWSTRPRISLTARTEYIETTSDPTEMKRMSLYTPELQLMAETNEFIDDPVIAYEYVWFGGQPVAQIGTATGDITWYFNDHLGTPILQTDVAANVVWRVEREPYGTTVEKRAGAALHQPLAFPGQEEHGTDSSYNIFRWYRSGWGRYTQADPLGLDGAGGLGPLNQLYPYAGQNPAGMFDRRGLLATKGCNKDEAAFIKAAEQLAEQAITAPGNCLECNKGDKNKWLQKLKTTTYNCINDGQEEFLKTSGKIASTPQCGFAGNMFGDVTGSDVSFTVKGMTEHNENPLHGCGCMQGLLLHEVAHLMGYPDDAPGAPGAASLAKKCISCAQDPNAPLTDPPGKGWKD